MADKDFELYENEDGTAYAVLVSTNYGVEWSRGNPFLACNKDIVEFWLAHKDDEQFMKEVGSYGFMRNKDNPVYQEVLRYFIDHGLAEKYYDLDDNEEWNLPFMGGFAGIELEWVPYGVLWRIDSYDGAESVEYFSPSSYNCFTKSA